MDLRDIMAEPTGISRPDHPDFWLLSEIILGLKAETEDMSAGRASLAETEAKWRAHYEAIGDFDSIAYCAVQAGLDLHSIKTGADWAIMMGSPLHHQSYVKSVQAYFDGFVMGAMLERKKREQGKTLIDNKNGVWRKNDRTNDGTEIDRVAVIMLLEEGKATLTDRAAIELAREVGE